MEFVKVVDTVQTYDMTYSLSSGEQFTLSVCKSIAVKQAGSQNDLIQSIQEMTSYLVPCVQKDSWPNKANDLSLFQSMIRLPIVFSDTENWYTVIVPYFTCGHEYTIKMNKHKFIQFLSSFTRYNYHRQD